MFEVLGYVGIGISLAAYLPQIRHLALEQSSAGISRRAWLMWVASSLLVGAVAVKNGESVFITLQACNLISTVVIVVLAHRYARPMTSTNQEDGWRRAATR
jgi:hypothetical protein